ncbi:MAG: thiamine diphosphokinase [Ruminococcaceae bacterium]|nr:thiamine diphosphokinase [Oscillospiraceae bacterium]MBO4971671.1 thiamine diphosphokinase [Clostridia bacterium]MBQ1258820.1 thiamine diphosphokinase [Clostridia bacterium]
MNANEKLMNDIESMYDGTADHVRAFIYTGGSIDASMIHRSPKNNDIAIAADSGYNNAVKLGVRPDIAVGDFDSFSDKKIPSDIERITVPSEKDFTDTMLAVNTALERGAREIIIIGGLDGRLDHTLSNLAILERLSQQHICATIEDGKNRVRYIESTSTLVARSKYKYLSLIAADKKIKGVCIEGCKYPLDNAVLKKDHQYAVSNEISGNVALISVKKGGLYIIESSDS